MVGDLGGFSYDKWVDFINKFYLPFDNSPDTGAELNYEFLYNNNWKAGALRGRKDRTVVQQIRGTSKFFGAGGLLKPSEFKKDELGKIPWNYGSIQRAVYLIGGQYHAMTGLVIGEWTWEKFGNKWIIDTGQFGAGPSRTTYKEAGIKLRDFYYGEDESSAYYDKAKERKD